MDPKLASVTTIAGTDEVDQAIATLVLAFGTDPVARWMYRDPHRYLRHIPGLFRALGTSSFEAGAAQRTSDGLGVALWLPPGVQGNHERVEAVVTESVAQEMQADVSAVFERTEQYRPGEPHWYCHSSASKLCIGTTGVVRLYCSKGFANAFGTTALHISGHRIGEILLFTKGMVLRSWARYKQARRPPSSRCYAMRAEDPVVTLR
jgi:hypothetical protein